MICVLSYLSLRVKRSNTVNYARTRLRATLLFTGLPRHLRWLAMTEVCEWGCTWGQSGNAFLNSLTTPPLRGTPSIERELRMALYFFILIYHDSVCILNQNHMGMGHCGALRQLGLIQRHVVRVHVLFLQHLRGLIPYDKCMIQT